MRSVPVRTVDAVDPAILHDTVQAFGACHSLAHLMRWIAAQLPAVQIAEIVTQDEYTHDVILAFGSAFLSFDTS